MKVVTIVGARPQFVKAAVVSRKMREVSGFDEVLIHTGQHYDDNMSDQFFRELEIPRPHHSLGIGSLSQGAQTGRMLESVEQVLMQEKPDVVLVYGDTNSTLAGALAAVKLHIPVAHVEAGLRSGNRRMPEEFNRILTDHASDLLFCPTAKAVENLQREGIPEERVTLVGDVMYDAALFYGAKAEKDSTILQELELEPKGFILATIHRAENTDDPENLRRIFDGLRMVSGQCPVVIPLHPRTAHALKKNGMTGESRGDLKIIAPVGYLDMIMLEKNARLIATDSGGVQKEAFFYHVPCAILREETEWEELVDHGFGQLMGTDAGRILDAEKALRSAAPDYSLPLYGTGETGNSILERLK